MRKFEVTWYSKKDKAKIERHNTVMVSKPNGDIGKDAKAASEIFCATFGSLKKNEIVKLQEIDDAGAPIGEPITPMEDSSVVPVRK